MILSSARNFQHFDHLKESYCFQHFGFDVIIQDNWHPLICEVNKGPDMTAKNEYEEVLKNNMLKDILAITGITREENVGFIKILEQEVHPKWIKQDLNKTAV